MFSLIAYTLCTTKMQNDMGKKKENILTAPPTLSHDTHRNQSTAKIRLMSSVGSPTEVSTISIVMRPALGILAAPILAHVAVKLKQKKDIEANSDETNTLKNSNMKYMYDTNYFLKNLQCFSE